MPYCAPRFRNHTKEKSLLLKLLQVQQLKGRYQNSPEEPGGPPGEFRYPTSLLNIITRQNLTTIHKDGVVCSFDVLINNITFNSVIFLETLHALPTFLNHVVLNI